MPPAPKPDGPWAETLDHLSALDPYWAGEVGVPEGGGAGWSRLGAVAIDGEVIGRWLDDVAREHGGQRDVAASYLTGWLAGAAVLVPIAAYVVDARLPDPTGAANWWVHRHADGWFDRVAFESGRVIVGDADLAAAHPDSVVMAEAEALDLYAAALVGVLLPALEHIRGAARYGRRGLWGIVADEVAGAALWAARVAKTDGQEAWRVANTVIDAIAAQAHWLRARPHPLGVEGPDGPTLFPVRGTCCLYYKTQPRADDPSGDGYCYCTTCPLRDETSRRERLVRHLTTLQSEN